MRSVAVIGCGPSSLAAVHAAVGMGMDVDVLAPMTKSPLRGPLLLQRPIPGITLSHPDGYVRQHVVGGTILDYRYKLYGDVNISINGDILERGYHAWKMDETYDEMWRRYIMAPHRNVWLVDGMVTRQSLIELAGRYDLVINTAPANLFCSVDEHEFHYKKVAIRAETSVPDQEDNSIYFNAVKGVPWVRSSHIFGNRVTEWPMESAPGDCIIIKKPIHTNCDCNPTVFRTGRFGAWKNEVWVDSAYYQTREALMGV